MTKRERAADTSWTITREQIEAAVYEIATMRHNKEIWSDTIAKAALTAAAEVERQGRVVNWGHPATTPAQIEAAAKAICKSRSCEGIECCQWPAQAGRLQCPVKDGGYDDAAIAALTAAAEVAPTISELTDHFAKGIERAAAEVGEHKYPWREHKIVHGTNAVIEQRKIEERAMWEQREHTIERCAEVVEAHYESYCGKRIEQIAAAIRALKDK